MDIAYYTVVNDSGKPISAIIKWEDFLEIKERLGITSQSLYEQYEAQSSDAKEAAKIENLPEKTAEHVEGGDFEPLKNLGIKLPEAIQKKMPLDQEEEEDIIDGIKLGKRIR